MGVLILCRLNTVAYLGVGFILFEIGKLFIYRGPEKWKELKKEFYFVVKYSIVVFLSGGWYLVFQFRNVLRYYITAHAQGNDPLIRALEQGVASLWDNLLFYPKTLFTNHLGRFLTIVIIFIFVVFGCLLLVVHRYRKIGFEKGEKMELWALVSAIAAPIIVLTIDLSKSAVVGGIVTGSIVALACYVMSMAYSRFILRRVIPVFSVLLLLAGIGNYVVNTTDTHKGYDKETQAVLLEINGIVSDFILENGMKDPIIFIDRNTDGITAETVTVYTYEKQNKLINLNYATSMGVTSEFTEEDILIGLERADVVVASEEPYVNPTNYLIDASFDKYRDVIWNYATDNMQLIDSVVWGEDVVSIFGRR